MVKVFLRLLFYTLVDSQLDVRYYFVDMAGGMDAAGCVRLYHSIFAPFYWVCRGIFVVDMVLSMSYSHVFLWKYWRSICPRLCVLCADVRRKISFLSLVVSHCCLHSVQTQCRSFLY